MKRKQTGDAVLLGQLVHNLVSNAVRHNHPGGSIRITTTRTAARSSIKVHNTGPAVTTEDVDDLFQPFRRGTSPAETAHASVLSHCCAPAYNGAGPGRASARACMPITRSDDSSSGKGRDRG
ncbi:sensor histidine kinase [Streptomyces sp. NPDC001279]|uniref:sensor histidine kinase n=1 Tax=Streptomyces sp. NPDC001279 TaxID=3364556 RepID=UPI0036C0C3DE